MSTKPNYTQYQDPSLTQTDITTFRRKRIQYFKGTIAVTVVYGVLTVGLFLLAAFTARGREIITGDALPFTIAFVVGITIVVISLVVFVTTAKPVHIPLNIYDGYKCPDYWKLTPTDGAALNNVRGLNSQLSYGYAYKCVPPKNKKLNNPSKTSFDPNSGTISENMRAALRTMQGPSVEADDKNNVKSIKCDANYPQYLYLQDLQYPNGNLDPSTNNFVRCQIARSCGYSWTSVCPNIPASDL